MCSFVGQNSAETISDLRLLRVGFEVVVLVGNSRVMIGHGGCC